jgi:hypothetical protein
MNAYAKLYIDHYDAAAVKKQINKEPTIKKSQAKLIHRLLRGWRKNNGTQISKENT